MSQNTKPTYIDHGQINGLTIREVAPTAETGPEHPWLVDIGNAHRFQVVHRHTEPVVFSVRQEDGSLQSYKVEGEFFTVYAFGATRDIAVAMYLKTYRLSNVSASRDQQATEALETLAA